MIMASGEPEGLYMTDPEGNEWMRPAGLRALKEVLAALGAYVDLEPAGVPPQHLAGAWGRVVRAVADARALQEAGVAYDRETGRVVDEAARTRAAAGESCGWSAGFLEGIERKGFR